MKFFIKQCGLVVLSLFVSVLVILPQTVLANCGRDDVLQAEQRWADAIGANNAEEVAKLYLDNAVLLPTVENNSITTTQGRIDYFKKLFNTYKGTKVVYQGKKYIETFPGGAVVSGAYVFSGMQAGNHVSIPARYTFVYEAMPEGCKIIAQHSSKQPN